MKYFFISTSDLNINTNVSKMCLFYVKVHFKSVRKCTHTTHYIYFKSLHV